MVHMGSWYWFPNAFLVDSCQLLEDKQSLAREEGNVPKNDMHANPKIYIRRLVEPKGYHCYCSSFGNTFWELIELLRV